MAGRIYVEDWDFTFEVWAYEPMTEAETIHVYRTFLRQRDRRKSLKGKLIRILSNHGLPLR